MCFLCGLKTAEAFTNCVKSISSSSEQESLKKASTILDPRGLLFRSGNLIKLLRLKGGKNIIHMQLFLTSLILSLTHKQIS